MDEEAKMEWTWFMTSKWSPTNPMVSVRLPDQHEDLYIILAAAGMMIYPISYGHS